METCAPTGKTQISHSQQSDFAHITTTVRTTGDYGDSAFNFPFDRSQNIVVRSILASNRSLNVVFVMGSRLLLGGAGVKAQVWSMARYRGLSVRCQELNTITRIKFIID